MKIYTNSHSSFPDQVVPDAEKATFEYGLRVGRAIEGEWFWAGQGRDKFYQNYNNFHQLRLYARGEQSIQKYKDELAINGDVVPGFTANVLVAAIVPPPVKPLPAVIVTLL